MASASAALTRPASMYAIRPFTSTRSTLHANRLSAVQPPNVVNRGLRCCSPAKASSDSQEGVSALGLTEASIFAAGAPFLWTAAAFADELNEINVPSANAPALEQFRAQVAENTSQAADQVVAAAATSTVPPIVTGLVVFSPLILYGIFVAYRAKLNPRASITDFAFIVAGIVVVLNLLSILIFKIRLF